MTCYDPLTKTLLSEEFGQVAVAAADLWLVEMPNGGTFHLTEDGHACRIKDGAWLYLGRLDPGRPDASVSASASTPSMVVEGS